MWVDVSCELTFYFLRTFLVWPVDSFLGISLSSINRGSFISSFTTRMPFIFLIALLQWLELPVLCRITKTFLPCFWSQKKAFSLWLFLTIFDYITSKVICKVFRYSISGWKISPLFLVYWVFFVIEMRFFWIYWDDHVYFLYSFDTMYYINWYSCFESLLQTWNKSHLVTVYNPFCKVQDSIC